MTLMLLGLMGMGACGGQGRCPGPPEVWEKVSPAPSLGHILESGWLAPGKPLIICRLESLTPGPIYRV